VLLSDNPIHCKMKLKIKLTTLLLFVAGIGASDPGGRQAEEVVLADMITRRSLPKPDYYGAYFIVSPVDIDALKKRLPNNVPRVEVGKTNLVLRKKNAFDKKTNKPGLILSANIKTISETNATVSAGWWSGPETSGVYEYTLTNAVGGTNWTINSRRLEAVF
jgi:hypothetical protein